MNGGERGRLKNLLHIWKILGVSERDLLDLQCLEVGISNPKVRISREEVWNNDGPGDLNLWCGQLRHGKVQDQLHLLQAPSEQGGAEAQGAPERGRRLAQTRVPTKCLVCLSVQHAKSTVGTTQLRTG